MRNRKIVTGILGLSIAAIMTGCGGSGGSTSKTTQGPSAGTSTVINIWHSYPGDLCEQVAAETYQSLSDMGYYEYSKATLTVSVEPEPIKCEDYGMEDLAENPKIQDPDKPVNICMEIDPILQADTACVSIVQVPWEPHNHHSALETKVAFEEVGDIAGNIADNRL